MATRIPTNEPLITEKFIQRLEIMNPETKLQIVQLHNIDDDTIIYPTNILSSLLFKWIYSTLKFAKRFQLKINLLSKISSKYHADNYLNEIKPEWYGKYQYSRRLRLFRALLLTNYYRIILILLLSSITVLLQISRIYLFRQVLLIFQETKTVEPITSFTNLIIALLVVTFFDLFISRHADFLTVMTGCESIMQLNTLIYDKLLKVATFDNGVFSEGEMINYIQIDAEKFADFMSHSPKTLILPFQLGFYIYFLFQYFGPSFLFGLASLIGVLLLVSYLEKKKKYYQKKLMEAKDQRMKVTAQTFNMIKIIKLYSWEQTFINKINEKRDDELGFLKKINNYFLVSNSLYWSASSFLSLISIIFYNLFNNQMESANILTSIYIFNSLTDPLFVLPEFLSSLFEALVAFKRIEKFLSSKDSDDTQVVQLEYTSKYAIQLMNCSFGINNQVGMKETLLHNISLEIDKGELISVVGEVGSGKTCLLNAILNNLEVFDKKTGGNIKLNGAVAYVGQTPWILNDTVRNNILFFREMDKEKYETILEICELKQDLKLFNGGDMSEIGEKGIGLSGGQKARIAIARAIYSDADIYLFDDPLSALDAYVGMKIFHQVFLGYLKGKTRLISTHALQYISFTNRVIYMNQRRIEWFGFAKELETQRFYNDFIKNIANKRKDSSPNERLNNKAQDHDKGSLCQDNKLNNEVIRMTKDEEQKRGTFSIKVWWMFYMYAGGIIYFLTIIGANAGWKAFEMLNDYFLTYWAGNKTIPITDNMKYVGIYVLITLLGTVFVFIRAYYMTKGVFAYNLKMHDELLLRLMRAPVNLFHDTIPRAQIFNRLSKDLDSATRLNNVSSGSLRIMFQLLSCIIVFFFFNQWSIILIPIVMTIEIMILRFYLPGARDLNRLEGISRSPMITVFSETIPGVAIIRAYKYQHNFKEKFYKRLNDFFKIELFLNGAKGWFGVHLDMISFILLVFILLFSLIFKNNISSKAMGLLLTYSYKIIDYLYDSMARYSLIEKLLTSVERCDQFTKVIQEQPAKTEFDNQLDEHTFPSKGNIRFVDYNVKYRPETELVLKNLTFDIKAGEKIGVVGRTGSGKSTLCLCLFRILEPFSGQIFIDDVDISNLGLDLLRNSLTVIPQEPTLIEGSLRENVDPTRRYNDIEIQNALKDVGLDYLYFQRGLNYGIMDNGNNLSIGEKQLICIARALLRKSKIVLMDEATSSIDYKTETLIQETITKVLKDSTVITIAHRIKTIINYDRILVLLNGEIIEYDSPKNLLQNKGGLFSELYKESAI